jgi:hypothetical protein
MTAPIPFRTDAAVGAASYGVALAVTACLLLLVAAALVLARRKGWVAGLPRIAPSTPGSAIVHVGSKRLSPSVTVHTIQHGLHEYMIVESGRGAQVSVVALGDRT